MTGHVFVFEGLIGAGKTSLLHTIGANAAALFGKDREVVVMAEEMNLAFLNRFLANQKEEAFSFQLYTARNRIEVLRDSLRMATEENAIVLVDRGLIGDRTFAALHRKRGNIDKAQWELYESLTSITNAAENRTSRITRYGAHGIEETDEDWRKLLTIVYLKTNADVAFSRMRKRNTPGESDSYKIDYFRELKRETEAALATVEHVVVDNNANRKLGSERALRVCAEIPTLAAYFICNFTSSERHMRYERECVVASTY